MTDGKIEITMANEGDAESFQSLLRRLGIVKEDGFFARCLVEQKNKSREVFLARYGGELAGFVVLNWRPQYALFKRMEMPEIQDLNVLSEMRRNGIATSLIHHCEEVTRGRKSDHIGIAVGLDSSYGAAQRLYVKLGYVPDGNGITYDRQPVRKGELRPVDDDLCLMMVKAIS